MLKLKFMTFDKRPRTIVEITSEGEEELKRYVSKLKLAFSYEEMKK